MRLCILPPLNRILVVSFFESSLSHWLLHIIISKLIIQLLIFIMATHITIDIRCHFHTNTSSGITRKPSHPLPSPQHNDVTNAASQIKPLKQQYQPVNQKTLKPNTHRCLTSKNKHVITPFFSMQQSPVKSCH